jgi:class 3 adenylate cyclase/predicted ATPase
MLDDDEPSSSTLAFMFTDLVGSTPLWERLPESMRTAMPRHDEICARTIADHGGHLFKHTGDGVVAAFADAGNAARAAVELHLALADEPWPADIDIRARIGIHVGVAERRDGDYFGADVGRAARIMGAAHSQQVLVSATAAPMIFDAGFALDDLGLHRFKGVTEPIRVFHLADEHLPASSSFPPPASLDAPLAALPRRASLLPERKRVADQIAARMGSASVITLVGPSGIGKSRLAVELAHRLTTEYPDGVAFVDLGRGSPVAQTIAALGLAIAPDDHDALIGALGERQMLLVLDHADQQHAETRSLVGRIQTRCQRVVVVVTSSRPLGIERETIETIGPLTTDGRTLLLSMMPDDRPPSSVAELASIDEICSELDGNPLAIELAGARAAAAGIEYVLTHLATPSGATTDGVGRAERHRSVGSALDWTLSLLTDEQRSVIDAASTFASWFDVEDIADLLDERAVRVGGVFDEMVALALLRVGTVSAETRFRLGNSLRRHRREQLMDADHYDHLRDRHAHHIVTKVADAAPLLRTNSEREGRAAFLRVRAEVGPAIGRLLEAGDVGTAASMTASLAPFESICWPDIAEHAAVIVDHQDALGIDQPLPALTLAQAASARSASADLITAEQLARRAVDASIPTDGGHSWSVLANTLATGGRGENAAKAIEHGVDAARTKGDPFDLALSLSGQAIFAFWSGDVNTAMTSGEQAVDAAQRSGNETALASASGAFGTAAVRTNPTLAEELLLLSIELSADIGNVAHELIARRGLGLLARVNRDFETACSYLVVAMRLADETGSELEYRLCSGLFINAASRAGYHDLALAIERTQDRSTQLAHHEVSETAAVRARDEIGVVGSSRITLEAGRRTRRELLAWISGELENRTLAVR